MDNSSSKKSKDETLFQNINVLCRKYNWFIDHTYILY